MLLAACGSAKGASREIFQLASPSSWVLVGTPWVFKEVENNLDGFPTEAKAVWAKLQGQIDLHSDVLTLDRPVVFEPVKDRPVLFSALAWADILLTLDRRDFGPLLGRTFYGLTVLTPGMFLMSLRGS